MTKKSKTEQLDLEPLEKAVLRLADGLCPLSAGRHRYANSRWVGPAFEFTCEISHKMLKRFLEATSPTPEPFDTMAFADLIRSGNERGLLLGDWPKWREYRAMRSKTSHAYDEEVAVEVVAGIPAFLDEARHLLEQLRVRNLPSHD